MSANCHVVSVALELRDLHALRMACSRLGWHFAENQLSYNWFGSWQDDSPLPEHLFEPDELARIKALPRRERCRLVDEILGRCDHAIQVPGAKYEVGVKTMSDGRIVLLWDWWGDGGLVATMGKTGDVLMQAYAVERAKLEAQAQGHWCREQQQEDGSIKVTITIPEG
jgi:hypothetical protein